MNQRETMKQMPIAAKISFLRQAWEREKEMRIRYLSGANRNTKVDEANIALDCIDSIEAHLKGGAA